DTVMEALRAKYGLDKPVFQQLLMYIGNALQGDFGISIPDGRAVTDIIRDAFPVSFDLGIRALLFAFIMGILLGIVAAVKRGTAWDSGAMFLALVGVSVPSFIMGAVLQYFLALKLGQATGVQVFSIERRYRHTYRSEEHTSELQSRFDLVCRLLLEKKKKNTKYD